MTQIDKGNLYDSLELAKIHQFQAILNKTLNNFNMTKEQTNSWEEEFVEKGADLEHTRWSKWQEYFFSKCKTGRIDEDDKEVVLVLPRGLYDRWWLQINTLYSELSEAEKESDRREVRQYLPLLKEIISQEKEQIISERDKEWVEQMRLLKQLLQNK